MRLLLVLLTFLPGFASAAESLNAFPLTLTPPPEDISLNYLTYLFGNVDGVLHGSSGQLLGTIFGIFNSAVLTLGGIILVYVLIVSVLSTAHEGEVMGKKWSSIWIPLRSVLGVGLLVPKASGYSTLQVLIMWIVVQGIGVADSIWGATLSYINMGGVIITRPSLNTQGGRAVTVNNTGINEANWLGRLQTGVVDETAGAAARGINNEIIRSNQIPAIPGSALDQSWQDKGGGLYTTTQEERASLQAGLPLAANIFNSLVCLASIQDQLTQKNSEQGTTSSKTLLSTVVPIDYRQNSVSFPGPGTGVPTGICGTVSWSSVDIDADAAKSFTSTQYQYVSNSRLIGVQQMIYDLQGPAQAIASNARSSTPQPIKQVLSSTDILINAVRAYATFVNPAFNLSQVNAGLRENLTMMRNEGWIMAGSYYAILTSPNLGAKSKYETKYPDTNLPTAETTYNRLKNEASWDNKYAQAAVKPLNSDLITLTQDLKNPDFVDTASASRKINLIKSSNLVSQMLPGIPESKGVGGKLDSAMSGIFTPINNFVLAIGDSMSPITQLTILGNAICAAITVTWILIIALIFGASLGLSWIPFVTVSGSLTTLAGLLTPFTTGIFLPLYTIGAVMAFYIPMIPFIVFAFAAMGWFVAVIEAMIAAPLIALGMMHPAGDDHFGKAEHSIMLLLNIFLRPGLMVFGFISACILSYIGLWLLIRGFTQAFFTNFFSNPITTAGMFINILLAIIVFLGLLTTLSMTIVQKSFDLIHIIPDEVLRWIGGANTKAPGSFQSAEALKDSRGSIESGAKGSAGTAEIGGKGLEAIGQRNEKKKENKG